MLDTCCVAAISLSMLKRRTAQTTVLLTTRNVPAQKHCHTACSPGIYILCVEKDAELILTWTRKEAYVSTEDQLKAVKLSVDLRDSSRQLYHLFSGTEYKGTVKVIKKTYDDLEKLRGVVDRLLENPDRHRWQGLPSKNGRGGWIFTVGLISGLVIACLLLSTEPHSAFETESGLIQAAHDRP
jgi:hypothetical protein